MINPMEHIDSVRSIPPEIDPLQLEHDLEHLRHQAIRGGAGDTAIIDEEDVIFNQDILMQVSADASYPSIHWPLNYPMDDVEEAIRAYQKGLFFRVIADIKVEYGGGPIPDPDHQKKFFKVYEIVSLLESICFYQGYHLAVGFAAGNCRSVFCNDEKRCLPMLNGKPCIYPNKGRPSLEAVGIDARKMADNLNWKILDSRTLLFGLLMVA